MAGSTTRQMLSCGFGTGPSFRWSNTAATGPRTCGPTGSCYVRRISCPSSSTGGLAVDPGDRWPRPGQRDLHTRICCNLLQCLALEQSQAERDPKRRMPETVSSPDRTTF
mmetsp:Transcript_18320/g.50522  ORF Transcript_18320/g.50522 Transcript_18320/m.50522 type:complete len:110 (-) Transcript_18320:177-506(-)